jgi:Pyruvate/2-oxoacid:ferredoxin oxidoreductase delta subunit
VPIEGATYDLPFTTLIAAISQTPDFKGFENLIEGKDWIKADKKFATKEEGVFSGGDNINLGLVIDAIYHGRMAALGIHEMISTEEQQFDLPNMGIIKFDKMKLNYYDKLERVEPSEIPAAEALANMDAEIVKTFTQDQAVAESKRCMSCGYCFDCGSCWSYCQDQAVIKPLVKGEHYSFKLEFCNGCKKCAENCPCGYIEMH